MGTAETRHPWSLGVSASYGPRDGYHDDQQQRRVSEEVRLDRVPRALSLQFCAVVEIPQVRSADDIGHG